MSQAHCPACGATYPDNFAFCKADGSRLITQDFVEKTAQPAAHTLNVETTTPHPTCRLYDSGAVGIATLFGSPAAGTFLMALNYSRLGEKGWAWGALAVGMLVTALAVLIGQVIPQSASPGIIGIALFFATWRAAKAFQGGDIEKHIHKGGELVSKWAAFGIGLAVLCVEAIIVIAVVLAFTYFQDRNSRVMIGSKDEVYYSAPVTKQDAQALGVALKDIGYFRDSGLATILSKEAHGTTVSFVVKDRAWERPDIVEDYEVIGRALAPSIGGFPVRVRLADSSKVTKKEMVVGKTFVGDKDHIYYQGSATEAEAKALGDALKTDGFFRNEGFTVVFAKHENETIISFVVSDGSWDNPQNVAVFEGIVRRAAHSVGNLPIKMRLIDRFMEAKKETIVN